MTVAGTERERPVVRVTVAVEAPDGRVLAEDCVVQGDAEHDRDLVARAAALLDAVRVAADAATSAPNPGPSTTEGHGELVSELLSVRAFAALRGYDLALVHVDRIIEGITPHPGAAPSPGSGSPGVKVCQRCRDRPRGVRPPARWTCRTCGAACCEHLCGFKKDDAATCGSCARGAPSAGERQRATDVD